MYDRTRHSTEHRLYYIEVIVLLMVEAQVQAAARSRSQPNHWFVRSSRAPVIIIVPRPLCHCGTDGTSPGAHSFLPGTNRIEKGPYSSMEKKHSSSPSDPRIGLMCSTLDR